MLENRGNTYGHEIVNISGVQCTFKSLRVLQDISGGYELRQG